MDQNPNKFNCDNETDQGNKKITSISNKMNRMATKQNFTSNLLRVSS